MSSKTLTIHRSLLMDALKAFAFEDHGIVIGAPGSGKTYMLKELRRKFEAGKIPHLYLPVDQLGNASEEELKSRLGYETNFINELKIIGEKNVAKKQACILILDGFDAARDEEKRERILWYIKCIMRDLKGLWQVIVSVRTYDAKKSLNLLSLFQNTRHLNVPSSFKNPDSEIPCPHLYIPLLTEDEVKSTFTQINCLEKLYSEGSEDFRSLLKLPFNLWLIARLVEKDISLDKFSQINSEVQLLKLFWEQRVNNQPNSTAKRVLLSKITSDMVSQKSLFSRIEKVYDPGLKKEWDELASDEVIHDDDSRKAIGFTHNILFDYAVSELLIDDKPEELVKFITQEPSRPLFLRPSITYYFTRLWHDKRDLFWKAFWHVLPSENPNLKLFARLVPTAVIVTEVQTIEDLNPIIEAHQKNTKDSDNAILKILQALRTLSSPKEDLWIAFFKDISKMANNPFLWDLTTITSEILDKALKSKQGSIVSDCGHIARALLTDALDKRNGKEGAWIDRLASNWMTPMVAKTFSTDRGNSRSLLEKVLELTKEPFFPISYIYKLTDEIDHIWPYDADFVSKIYMRVFEYVETSNEETHMGGIVLPLMSTRRQDYDMCQYSLIKKFKQFLISAPLKAIETGIKVLNQYIISNEVIPYLKERVELKNTLKTFNYDSKTCNYLPDISYVWDETEHEDRPIEISNEIFEFIESLAKNNNRIEFERILNVFKEYILVAYFWRKLLESGKKYSSFFSKYLYELCLAEPIITGNETVYSLGEFLKASITFYSKEQREAIEKKILNIPNLSQEQEKKEFLENRRDKLLGCLPEMVTAEAKNIYEEVKKRGVPANEPLVKFSSYSKPFTTEDWLKEQGADLSKKQNIELKDIFKELDSFNSKWNNEKPALEDITNIIPHAEKLQSLLQTFDEADKAVIEHGWAVLGGFAETVTKNIDDIPENMFKFCKSILLKCANYEVAPPDPKSIEAYKSPHWSSTPLTEAAQGLPRIAYRISDKEVENAIKKLSCDPDPSVRYLLASRLSMLKKTSEPLFWSLLEARGVAEDNNVVKHGFIYTISRVLFHDTDKSIKILELLFPTFASLHDDFQTMEDYVFLIMRLALVKEHKWALKKLDEIIEKPIELSGFLLDATQDVINEITPQKISTHDEDVKSINDKCFYWVQRFIGASFEGIKKILVENKGKQKWEKEEQKKLHDVYAPIDTVISRLYFSSDANEKTRNKGETPITEEQRETYYHKIKPLLNMILVNCNADNGILFAPSAHYFMEMLNVFLKHDPSGVLHMAVQVAKASQPQGYNLDSFAIREVVALVESILADHRVSVQQGAALNDLLELLDIFTQAGWTEALRLVWRLDEIFR